MTANSPDSNPSANSSLTDLDKETLVRSLRRKEGTWVEWGQACQSLQKSGMDPQAIFEHTGFEPIQQNQVVVGMQVYQSILNSGGSEAVTRHFQQKGSDILYELRILNHRDRTTAATLILDKDLDLDEAHEVAKAVKDFSRLSAPPEGFNDSAADAVAYHYWKLARQQSDLQARSRLIAQALRFAESSSARQRAEKLLTDFTVAPKLAMPLMPTYRLDSEDDLARIIPVVGHLPLAIADLKQVPMMEEDGAFQLVKFSGTGAWVPIPGWQVVRNAEDPVAILASSDHLPQAIAEHPEEVLILVDRAQRHWDINGFFLAEQNDTLELLWFDTEPQIPILGQLLLVLRPKKVLDENFTKDPWQVDE